MSTAQSTPGGSSTQSVARNALWYGLELLVGIIGAFATSVIVARIVGPERLGYYNYISWLTSLTSAVASVGLPISTRKYVAEYLGRGEPGIAKAIYRSTLKLQALISLCIVIVGDGLVFVLGRPDYWIISSLLIVNVAPRMRGFIPSHATVAAHST